jgi:hypothetical protein
MSGREANNERDKGLSPHSLLFKPIRQSSDLFVVSTAQRPLKSDSLIGFDFAWSGRQTGDSNIYRLQHNLHNTHDITYRTFSQYFNGVLHLLIFVASRFNLNVLFGHVHRFSLPSWRSAK